MSFNNNTRDNLGARGLLEPQTLEAISPRDKKWTVHKRQSDAVAELYGQAEEFEKRALRMYQCGGFLVFEKVQHLETSEARLRLNKANFCKNRYCPVCQWRRALKWVARFMEILPSVVQEHPSSPLLFLTLTARHRPVEEFRQTLQDMNKAWNRLRLRKEFARVVGWVRTTEVTYGKDGNPHPHFHCLLMVKPSYFSGKNYLTRDDWREAWRGAMRDPLIVGVDIRRCKGEPIKAANEVFKYSVKPADLMQGARKKGETLESFRARIEKDEPFLYELSRQTNHLRYIAAGGVFKDFLKKDEGEPEEETDAELIGKSEVSDWQKVEGEPLLMARWDREKRRYMVTPEPAFNPESEPPDKPPPDG
jgi:plasmid rolling circle replication initiator protein Rep